jgi:hypothetical protein
MGRGRDPHVPVQISAGIVSAEAAARASAEAASLARQDGAFRAAMAEVQRVYDLLGAPEHILGNPSTKHGEIAEQVEVGVRRARQVLEGLAPTAYKDGVPRTSPVDYVIDGVAVQSKFVNGVANNLDHVLDHLRKYPTFARDGAYYHIPRDHYAVIDRALRGEGHGELSARTLAAIAEKAREIQRLSGQTFSEVVRPGLSTYAEVQQGRVHQTLEGHERALGERDEALRGHIHAEHGPSLLGAAGVALQGAAIGASVRLAVAVWQKHRGGKRLFAGDYAASDWQELGLEAGVGGAQGAVSASAIYGLTHAAGVAAPFAGALVSSAMAVALTRCYQAGELSLDELSELGQLACVEGAVVGLAAAAGQAAIPVPALGATVGAIAGRLLASWARELLAGEPPLTERLSQEHDERMRQLDEASRRFVEGMLARYEALGALTEAAFDPSKNLAMRLTASVCLAHAHGVPQQLVLESVEDVDAFILGSPESG